MSFQFRLAIKVAIHAFTTTRYCETPCPSSGLIKAERSSMDVSIDCDSSSSLKYVRAAALFGARFLSRKLIRFFSPPRFSRFHRLVREICGERVQEDLTTIRLCVSCNFVGLLLRNPPPAPLFSPLRAPRLFRVFRVKFLVRLLYLANERKLR